MYVTRLYYNSTDDVIRIDQITRELGLPNPVLLPRVGNDPGLQPSFGPQLVKTTIIVSGSLTAMTNRTVAKVEVTGDYDSYDTTGAPYNILWASKTIGNGQIILIDMSGLASVGDSV
jgi:hypothetical protein